MIDIKHLHVSSVQLKGQEPAVVITIETIVETLSFPITLETADSFGDLLKLAVKEARDSQSWRERMI